MGAPGIALHATWRDFLLDGENEWRALLAASPLDDAALDVAFERLKQLADEPPGGRHLIHNDLLYRNVLVFEDKISAVLDWQCSLYGDFLYDIALLSYGAPWFPAMEGIDWEAEARQHFASIKLDVPELAKRLLCCKIHVGLSALGWNIYTEQWDEMERHLKRVLELARQ